MRDELTSAAMRHCGRTAGHGTEGTAAPSARGDRPRGIHILARIIQPPSLPRCRERTPSRTADAPQQHRAIVRRDLSRDTGALGAGVCCRSRHAGGRRVRAAAGRRSVGLRRRVSFRFAAEPLRGQPGSQAFDGFHGSGLRVGDALLRLVRRLAACHRRRRRQRPAEPGRTRGRLCAPDHPDGGRSAACIATWPPLRLRRAEHPHR